MSEKSDDNETDIKSCSKISSSAGSNVSDKSRKFFFSPHPGSSRSCKSTRSRSPILSSSSENEVKDDEHEDWDVLNRLYLRRIDDSKKEQECYEEEIKSYCRLIHSAPLMLPKSSNKVCNLKVIDEIDENECEENEDYYLTDSVDKESIFLSEEEILITPRQKEVPPKKKCLRPKTPVILSKDFSPPKYVSSINLSKKISNEISKELLKGIPKEVSDDLSKEVSQSIEKHNFHPNQRVNIGTKTFIFRNTKDTVKRSISIQVENPTCSLPHSVDEDSSSNVTLEPNIVVLDKSPLSESLQLCNNCNSPKGDAPDDEKKKVKIKNKKKNLTKKKRSWRVKKNTVDCSLSNSSSEISLKSPKNLNVFFTQTNQQESFTNPLLETQLTISNENLKTNTPITPESSKNSNEDIELVDEINQDSNKEYFKEILGDFRLGDDEIEINFNDLNLNEEDTFRMRGKELLQTPSLLMFKPIDIQNEMLSGNETNGEDGIKPLVESRRHQNVDMEFYDVSSVSTTNTTPRESLRWNEIFTPNLKLDCKDNEDLGCICLKCFKKKIK